MYNFEDYTQNALVTWGQFDNKQLEEIAATLGIAGESGEIADCIKKKYFHLHKDFSIDEVIEELGDLFYYLAIFMHLNDIKLEDVLKYNTIKLLKRYPDGFPGNKK